jgi:hypothetical protein
MDELKIKNVGMASKQKTPLAKLRNAIVIPRKIIKATFLKRSGKVREMCRIKDEPLPVKTIADWLGVKPTQVRAIECGKTGYRLTEKSARILEAQTGCCHQWLLGIRQAQNPITAFGSDWNQGIYEKLQRRSKLSRIYSRRIEIPNSIPAFSDHYLKVCVEKLALIILRSAHAGKLDEVATTLEATLDEMLVKLPALPVDGNFTDLRNKIDFGYTDLKAPDFRAMLKDYKRQIMKICGDKITNFEKQVRSWRRLLQAKLKVKQAK